MVMGILPRGCPPLFSERRGRRSVPLLKLSRESQQRDGAVKSRKKIETDEVC
jgi:hypothetical protein